MAMDTEHLFLSLFLILLFRLFDLTVAHMRVSFEITHGPKMVYVCAHEQVPSKANKLGARAKATLPT